MPYPFTRAALALLMLAGTLLTAGAANEANRAWEFNQTPEPTNQGRVTPRLSFSVPQTDDIQVSGYCFVSGGAGVARLVFGTDIDPKQAGKEVDVQFSGGGFSYVHAGKVVAATSETGMNGVQLELDMSDALFGAMASRDGFDYLVPGARAGALSFARGRDQIARFNQACQAFATNAAAPQVGPVEVTDGGGQTEFGCDRLGRMRSQNSNTPTEITFANKSNATRGVLWIGFDGVPKDYGNIGPGERRTFKTFLTHPWMITDGPGNCIQIDMPIAGGSVVFTGTDAPTSGAKVYVPPKTTHVPPKPAKVRTSCPPGTVPVPETDNCVPAKIKPLAHKPCPRGTIPVPPNDCMKNNNSPRNPCPVGQYLEGATGICRQPGYANVPQTPKQLQANHGCGKTQQWNPQSKQCEEND